MLETIALNDNPEIVGKTGRRVERKMSNYSKRKIAKFSFEDLLRQLNFNHVIISYSNQSLIPLEELINLASKFAIDEEVEVRTIDYREYRNLNSSQKSNGTQLQEVLIYFKKDKEIIKSPLNYAGSKDLVMKKIINSLPQHITNFVDMMGGAFNVGANISGTGKVFYNENNFFVYNIIDYLLKNKNEFVLKEIKYTINKYQLSKKDKENYINFRNYYNSLSIHERQPIDLFVLTLYSFQHMIRFNSKGGFNVPVGNSGLTEDIVNRIYNFRTKMPIGELILGSFENIDINNFDKDTIFYFDPPYIITAAAYNDGRRFKSEWTFNNELKLLNFLDKINNN
ncbi:DNA adenine methylase [Staphylococcus haemolyticus]|uniref:DNA adenine methylase n=1 Tax=Staphylococcus haemolyticus TaxID=1283 RepID=UPI0032D8B5B6